MPRSSRACSRSAAAAEALPETVQGIIAARLDALTAEEKEVLQDAAVLGKVFWLGRARRRAMRRLEEPCTGWSGGSSSAASAARPSPARASTPSGTLLVREVAYGQIPRAGSGGEASPAAEWIEALGRPEDHAEMLAHHYLQAARARAPRAADEAFCGKAREALIEAADRAFSLTRSRRRPGTTERLWL